MYSYNVAIIVKPLYLTVFDFPINLNVLFENSFFYSQLILVFIELNGK